MNCLRGGITQAFIFIPDPGRRVSEAFVDRALMPATNSYAFFGSNANLNTSVSFVKELAFSVMATADANTVISPAGAVSAAREACRIFDFSAKSE